MHKFFAIMFLLVVSMTNVSAQNPEIQNAKPEDREAAKTHYKAGENYYDHGKWQEALKEFLDANKALPKVAEITYNIVKCYEKLEDYGQALVWLEVYMGRLDTSTEQGKKDKKEADDLLAFLQTRLDRATLSPDKPAELPKEQWPTTYRYIDGTQQASSESALERKDLGLFKASIAVGVFALASAGIGGGLIGSIGPELDHRNKTCQAPCDVNDLKARLYAGDALLAIAGVAAVTGVVTIVMHGRVHQPHHKLRASFAPTFGGLSLTVGGEF